MANHPARRPNWNEEILTSREACEFFKIGRTKLWGLTHRGLIPAYRVRKGQNAGLRCRVSELIAWLDNNRIGKSG